MTKTAMIVTGAVIALGIWDLIAVTYLGGVEVSISRFLQNSALKAPFIPFSFGFIAGHLWGYMPPVCPECPEDPASEDDTE